MKQRLSKHRERLERERERGGGDQIEGLRKRHVKSKNKAKPRQALFILIRGNTCHPVQTWRSMAMT